MSHLLSPVGFMLVKQPFEGADGLVFNLEIDGGFNMLIDGGFFLAI